MIEEAVAGEDLDVAVVVDVGQGDRARVDLRPVARAGPLLGPVVLEGHRVAADDRGHDLGQAVAVDVAERRGHGVVDRVGDLEVQRAGQAVEHVDVADDVRLARARRGHHDHVRDVAQVDRAVLVVVGEVGDQRGDDAELVAVRSGPRPLDLGLEAVGRGLLVALADRVHVVLHLAQVDRRPGRAVGLGAAGPADVELRPGARAGLAARVPARVAGRVRRDRAGRPGAGVAGPADPAGFALAGRGGRRRGRRGGGLTRRTARGRAGADGLARALAGAVAARSGQEDEDEGSRELARHATSVAKGRHRVKRRRLTRRSTAIRRAANAA